MGLNSTEVAYGFGQLGAAHMRGDHGEDLTPPDGMVIVAITMLSDTQFDKLASDTNTTLVYPGGNQTNAYIGIIGNAGGNSEILNSTVVFPQGMTIYGRWTRLSLHEADTTGGIIAYFGY